MLFFAPNDVARNADTVRLKYQREILGDVDGLITSRAAPEMDILLTTQLTMLPPNAIVPDINTGLRGFARLSMRRSFCEKPSPGFENRRRLRTPWAWYATRVYRITML